MSQLGFKTDEPVRQHRRHRARGWVAVLAALVVVVGGVGFAAVSGNALLSRLTAPSKDYAGAGEADLTVTIPKGSSLSAIGDQLTRQGVVGSSDAFLRAARRNAEAEKIQAGTYRLRTKMSGAAAVAALLDTANLAVNRVTIPEGMRAESILAALAKKTKLPLADYQKAAANPTALGAPSYAKSIEGYLFPATYDIPEDVTAVSMLELMVARYQQEAEKFGLNAAARANGLTDAGQLVTVASLVQAEARHDVDFPRVSRVVYNRLRAGDRLRFDSTAKYAEGYDGKVLLSKEQLNSPSRYNTYQHAGLPPGPINSPGEDALRAAVYPTPGSWLYFVTTDPSAGTTEFASTDAEFSRLRAKLLTWCGDNPGKC